MRLTLATRSLGLLILLYAVAILPCLMISLSYDDDQQNTFLWIAIFSACAGLALWRYSSAEIPALRTRDGFAVVSMYWLAVSLIGSLPFIIGLKLNAAAAFFESASALTTTGATVLIGLDTLPESILFYRQEMQWLGGVGIIVSAVALLPMLGIGGMQLFKAETAGPIKDDKLTPRLYHAARNLWYIYAGMTIVCALLYKMGGMNTFDAIAHSLSTVSTGGFSTHDDSFAFFDSAFLETVAIVFMILGSISFNVHFYVMSRGKPMLYWRNLETRVFLIVTFCAVVIISLWMATHAHQNISLLTAIRISAFETVSAISSTGFGIGDLTLWPVLIPMLLIFVSFIGGCAGSTAGGMKIIRHIIFFKFLNVLLMRHVHPNLQRAIHLETRVISDRVVDAVGAYFMLYFAVFGGLLLLLMANQLDFVTAFGAVATCLNNLGPGLGEVTSNFASMNSFTHILMSMAMILGRLELFTILILFSPTLWKF